MTVPTGPANPAGPAQRAGDVGPAGEGGPAGEAGSPRGAGLAAAACQAGPGDVADPAGTADTAGPCGVHRRLRVDAERNRVALLDAAREVFAEQGLEAPLEEIALRAGVGIATLYRRFPNRGQLVAAALVGNFAQYAEAAERAL